MSEWSSVGVFKVLHPMKVGIQDLNENIVNIINTSVYTFIGTIDYGKNVSQLVNVVQREVVNAIKNMAGFRTVKVNVNVSKIKF